MVGCSCLFSRQSLHTTLHLRGVQDTPLLCALWEGREGFVSLCFAGSNIDRVICDSARLIVGSGLKG